MSFQQDPDYYEMMVQSCDEWIGNLNEELDIFNKQIRTLRLFLDTCAGSDVLRHKQSIAEIELKVTKTLKHISEVRAKKSKYLRILKRLQADVIS